MRTNSAWRKPTRRSALAPPAARRGYAGSSPDTSTSRTLVLMSSGDRSSPALYATWNPEALAAALRPSSRLTVCSGQ